jgi:hypothetical protein
MHFLHLQGQRINPNKKPAKCISQELWLLASFVFPLLFSPVRSKGKYVQCTAVFCDVCLNDNAYRHKLTVYNLAQDQ